MENGEEKLTSRFALFMNASIPLVYGLNQHRYYPCLHVPFIKHPLWIVRPPRFVTRSLTAVARPTLEARHSQAVQSLIGSFLDGLLLQPGPQLPPYQWISVLRDLQETKGLKTPHFSVPNANLGKIRPSVHTNLIQYDPFASILSD